MKRMRILLIIFLLLVFLAGSYVAGTFRPYVEEGYTNTQSNEPANQSTACPNLLIQKGNVLMLQNTNEPTVDGQNPLYFRGLDEYIKYLNLQRQNGINCPVLFLQQETNTQGQDVYRVRPSPFQLDPGLPPITSIYEERSGAPAPIIDASLDDKPYNMDQFPGFDPTGLQIGVFSELDAIHESTHNDPISDNPMDANWGGISQTQKSVDSGKYAGSEIYKPQLFGPKTVFMPGITIPGIEPPKDYI